MLLLVALIAATGLTVTPTIGDDVTAIDDGHELDSQWAIDEYNEYGYVEGDVNNYQLDIAIANEREAVADDALIGDIGTDWVMFEYHENIQRTIRIHIPSEYVTPYERAGVESATGKHTADFEPVQDGEYLQITVTVDGPATIVLPLEWDGQASYRILDRMNGYADAVRDHSPFAGETNWTEYSGEEVSQESAVKVADTADVEVQVDARPDSGDRVWIPAPKDATDEDVYYYHREVNGTVNTYVVSTVENPPDIRVGEDVTAWDRLRSEINSAMEIPRNITIPDWMPVIG